MDGWNGIQVKVEYGVTNSFSYKLVVRPKIYRDFFLHFEDAVVLKGFKEVQKFLKMEKNIKDGKIIVLLETSFSRKYGINLYDREFGKHSLEESLNYC